MVNTYVTEAFPASRFNVRRSLCSGAGTGGLGLAMEGPSEAKMSCTDNKDGSCSVEYIPYEPGTYNLNITYGGQPIKGTAAQHIPCQKHFHVFKARPLNGARTLL